MDDLIVSYLLLSGECPLPGIGKISIAHRNAVCDLASKELLPPENILQFDESTSGDITSIANFISLNDDCSTEVASARFKSWTDNLRQRLNHKEEVLLPFLGKLVKDANGSISFRSKSSLNVLKAVQAERVVHEAATHNVIVGDKVSSSADIQQLLVNTAVGEKDRFWIPAVIIFSVALLIIILYFVFNGSGLHPGLRDTPASYLLK